MVLPEPARGLWRRVSAALRVEMNALDGFEGWKMGGGTILAARWDHRKSTDIDLKVAHNAGLVLLGAAYGGTLDRTMERLGARRIEYRDQQISIHFDDGKIDIAQGRHVPVTGHTVQTIDGHAEVVSSTSQILHGKIHGRSLRSPVRDLFDFAVAKEVDPESLEIAINTLHPGRCTEAIDNWRNNRLVFQRHAATEIMPTQDRWLPVIADPAGEAERAITSRRYRNVTFGFEGRKLHATCICMDGAERHRAHSMTSDAELNDWLDRTGLAEYADAAPDRNARQMIREARRLAASFQAPERPPRSHDGTVDDREGSR